MTVPMIALKATNDVETACKCLTVISVSFPQFKCQFAHSVLIIISVHVVAICICLCKLIGDIDVKPMPMSVLCPGCVIYVLSMSVLCWTMKYVINQCYFIWYSCYVWAVFYEIIIYHMSCYACFDTYLALAYLCTSSATKPAHAAMQRCQLLSKSSGLFMISQHTLFTVILNE